MNKKIFHIVDDIKKIEELWKKLYFSNHLLTPFQSYEWNLQVQILIRNSRNIKYANHEVSYIIFDEKLIFPMDIDEKEKTISIIGQTECSDFLDFLYCDINKDDIVFLIEYLKKMYPNFMIILDRINERSLMSKLLKDLKYKEIQEKECYYISIPKETNFYNSLKKSSRQNFRTANNRANKDCINFDIKIENTKMTKEKSSELYSLYLERREHKDNDIKYGLKHFVKKLIKKIVHYDKKDLITEYSKNNNMFLSYLLVDSKVAAFYEGLIGHDDNIYIIRVAIDEQYRKYSFGIILLVNTIEKLKAQYNNFDLTRGNEDYKINYGGVLNYNYCFIF